MDYQQLLTYINSDLNSVKSLIKDSLFSDIALLESVNTQVLSCGGKMVRPILILLVVKALNNGKINNDAIKLATAAELLHNATLFHDDVADSGVLRRGRPTVMSILGEKASVLLGDYWLVKSIENLLSLSNKKIEIIQEFSSTLSNLALGEMLQLQKASTCDTTIEDYFKIIYNKTSSLFVTCATVGAMSINANAIQMEAVRCFATNLGQAFQIKDDILDYIGNDIGKPLYQDLKEHKITMPLLGAFTRSSKQEEEDIRAKLINIDTHPEYVQQIVDFINKYDGIEYSNKQLQINLDYAIQALNVLPNSTDKQYLIDLAYFIIGRNK